MEGKVCYVRGGEYFTKKTTDVKLKVDDLLLIGDVRLLWVSVGGRVRHFHPKWSESRIRNTLGAFLDQGVLGL